MTRKEFADLVNSVCQTELSRMTEDFSKKRDELGKDISMADLLAFSYTNSIESAARITAEIISKSGILQFDEE